jgi:hypothetical protein
MKRIIRTAAVLTFALLALTAPAVCEVERIDLDVQGYLCGL